MPDASNEHISEQVAVKMTPEELTEARRKFEAGQTTRRAALRKIGITAGAAFFAMFAVDDLARIAGKRLEQMHIDNKIADDLAKELRSVGVAFADTGRSSDICAKFRASPGSTLDCNDCNDELLAACKADIANNPGGEHCPCASCHLAGTTYCGGSYPTYGGLDSVWMKPPPGSSIGCNNCD